MRKAFTLIELLMVIAIIAALAAVAPQTLGLHSRCLGIPVETGVFRADMGVSLTNDGPVTIWLDSTDCLARGCRAIASIDLNVQGLSSAGVPPAWPRSGHV